MPLTPAQIENALNTSLEYYVRGQPRSQVLQDRPLLNALEKKKKTFAGGNDYISVPVKGVYTTTGQGFRGNDTVTYGNPTNTKRVKFRWFERHWGVTFDATELKQNGIHIVDSLTGENTSNSSESELIRLVNILEDKMEDMNEGSARDMETMLHLDGSQGAEDVPGLQALVLDDPTAAGSTIGGLDTVVNAWFRNRFRVDNTGAGGADTAINTATESIVDVVTTEMRQLRRYGGKPSIVLAGSDMLDKIIKELRSQGNYTDKGWSAKDSTDISVADVHFGRVPFVYDPMLDDIGRAKFMYALDLDRLRLRPMEGEDMTTHNPARPHNQYVFHRAKTWTGGLINDQPNAHGVYQFK